MGAAAFSETRTGRHMLRKTPKDDRPNGKKSESPGGELDKESELNEQEGDNTTRRRESRVTYFVDMGRKGIGKYNPCGSLHGKAGGRT